MVDYAKTTTTEVVSPQEQRGGKKSRKSGSAAVKGLTCPLCGKGIMETQRAFGCSDWKNGCHFTLWKDCLTRGGGPALNEKIVRLILEKGEVPGSTGVIRMKDGMISFTPAGKDMPSVSLPVTYEKSH